jgi:LCP family protein required for cell wall assembly
LQQEESSVGFGPRDEQPSRVRSILLACLGFGFLLFLAGSAYSGWLFLANFKVLAERRAIHQVPVPVAGGTVLTMPDSAAVLPLPGRPTQSSVAAGQERPQPPTDSQPGLLPQAQAQPLIPLPDWTGRERINVLLLGIDHREDEPLDASRADTLLVVSVDPASRSAVMVSLPRDLWVSIPGVGEQRLNVAHSMGGPELAMRTVTANFGIRLSHYARIDFRGFEQIVDTLGGIVVDVDRPIKDDEYPTDDYGFSRIYIGPGPQWMDGRTALQYARSRHSENDFGRARRQQRVLIAMRERAIQANMIFKAWELIPLAQKTVTTDFGPLDLAKLAKLASEIDRERVQSLVVDAQYASPITTFDGAQVLLPNKPAIQAAVTQAYAKSAALPTPVARVSAPAAQPTPAVQPTPRPVTRVEVYNGTTRQGLARSTADWLARQGVEVTRVDSAERSDYPETRLFVPPGKEDVAASLAAQLDLPGSAVETLANLQPGGDLRLVLGRNYQVPAR